MIERMENMVREVEEEDKRRRAQGQAAGGAGSAPAGAEADDDDYHSRHRYQDGEAPRPIMRPVFVDRTDPEEVRPAVKRHFSELFSIACSHSHVLCEAHFLNHVGFSCSLWSMLTSLDENGTSSDATCHRCKLLTRSLHHRLAVIAHNGR